MKKLVIFAPLIAVFLVANGLFTHGAEASALERFIKQYGDWHEVRTVKNSAFEEPWKPYMGKPFYEGLSLKQLKLYLSLQKSGDCFSVIQLDLIGFLTLYPHLTRAFEHKNIRSSFEHIIAYRHSEGARRCDALWSVRKASSPGNKIYTHEAIALPLKKGWLYSGSFFRSNRRSLSHLELPRKIIENSIMNIYYLAFCQGYVPAIKDIEEYSAAGKIILTPIDKTYLSIRKAELGINGVPSAQLYKKLNSTPAYIVTNKKRRSIEKQLFGSIEISFQTYYAKWCEPH